MEDCQTCQKNENIDFICLNTDNENPCINPLSWLIKHAIAKSNLENVSLTSSLNDILTEGVFTSNDNLYCCPDCVGPKGFYFLGSRGKFENLLTQLPEWSLFDNTLHCCLNYSANQSDSVLISQAIDSTFENEIPCCKNSFALDITELGLNVSDFSGVIEISGFSKKSGLFYLIKSLRENIPYIELNEIVTVISAILDIGILVKCDGCSILITQSSYSIAAVENLF